MFSDKIKNYSSSEYYLKILLLTSAVCLGLSSVIKICTLKLNNKSLSEKQKYYMSKIASKTIKVEDNKNFKNSLKICDYISSLMFVLGIFAISLLFLHTIIKMKG